MILAYYNWRLWGNDSDINGLFVIPILIALTAILIYGVDFVVKQIRKKRL
jgi:hypothetical protein